MHASFAVTPHRQRPESCFESGLRLSHVRHNYRTFCATRKGELASTHNYSKAMRGTLLLGKPLGW